MNRFKIYVGKKTSFDGSSIQKPIRGFTF